MRRSARSVQSGSVRHIASNVLSAMSVLLVLLFVLAGLFLSPADPGPVPETAVSIKEWTVPWDNTRPRDPYVGARNRVWFVGQRGNYLAYLNHEDGSFERYDLPDGTGPHNLIVEKSGTVWFAGNRDAYIGRLNPETGTVERFEMPNPKARDPHTLTFAPDSTIWFTVQGGNFVGHFTPSDGAVDLIEVPTPRARPYGIIVTNDGTPWFTEFGSNKLGTVDPKTMELTEIELPREDANPRRLSQAPDGKIWYVDYSQGYVGRYDPAAQDVQEWRVPGGTDARPYGMMTDDQGRAWFVETGVSPNRFVGFDPAAEEFTEPTPIESGGGTVRHMYYEQDAQAIWFGTDANTIGRATLPQ